MWRGGGDFWSGRLLRLCTDRFAAGVPKEFSAQSRGNRLWIAVPAVAPYLKHLKEPQ
jgi:hypothetical protein